MPNSGCVSDRHVRTLLQFPFFVDYRAGRLSHAEYLGELQRNADEISRMGGNSDHFRSLISRYPSDFEERAEEVFKELVTDDFVPGLTEPDGSEAFRGRVRAVFDHGGRNTYINPDEARLLHLLSLARKPRLLVVMGAYYGYWAIWAMPGVVAGGGRAVLIDPNAEVCDLARKNFEALGFGDRTEVCAEKAEAVLPRLSESADMALLDAWNPETEPPAHHGKGIYAPLTEKVFGCLAPDALLVVHNDYAIDVGANELSTPFLERAVPELGPFHAFCKEHFRKGRVIPTPDGFGVYVR